MKKGFIFIILVQAILLSNLDAQSFANGTLLGTIGISTTPTSWLQVPFGDPVSQSTMTLSATSDVTGTTGPVAGNINANPYHGTTLVSGLHMNNGGDTWHEGIMQSVSGFSVGTSYTIYFWQCVVKQSNATDQSGSWRVYRENTLIGTSAPSTDPAAVGSNAHVWHHRWITFTATATTHNIKFLPIDDDANWVSPAGVRMGIDSITIGPSIILPAPFDYSLSPVGDHHVKIQWEDQPAEGFSNYFIEHSPDGIHFETIASVNENDLGSFSFTDENPFNESFYRVTRVQNDGGMVCSEILHIETRQPLELEMAGRQLSIRGGYGPDYDLTILDIRGNVVFSARVPGSADLMNLPSGIFIIRVVSEEKEKFILERKFVLD